MHISVDVLDYWYFIKENTTMAQSLKYILLIGFFGLLLQNCSDDVPTACTAEFVIIDLTVLELNGAPADSVQMVVANANTGEAYDLCSEDPSLCEGGFIHGDYVIMHDGLFEEINSDEEPAIVVGIKQDLRFSQRFVFRSGPCHVQKLAGPDTVSLAANEN